MLPRSTNIVNLNQVTWYTGTFMTAWAGLRHSFNNTILSDKLLKSGWEDNDRPHLLLSISLHFAYMIRHTQSAWIQPDCQCGRPNMCTCCVIPFILMCTLTCMKQNTKVCSLKSYPILLTSSAICVCLLGHQWPLLEFVLDLMTCPFASLFSLNCLWGLKKYELKKSLKLSFSSSCGDV